MDLQTPLSRVSGIGIAYATRLDILGLHTVSDLIHHYPFRYDDFSSLVNVSEAQLGETVTLQGEIWQIKNIFTRSRKVLTQAIFNDGTTPITLTWFNSSWLTKQIKPGDRIQISGKLTKYKSKLSMMAPVWERITNVILGNDKGVTPESRSWTSQDDKSGQLGDDDMIHTGRLVPIYPETFGVSSKWIRTKVNLILPQVIHQITDPLPREIQKEMLPLKEAIEKIHFPKDNREIQQAQERLGFDELFLIALATLKARQDWSTKSSVEKFKVDDKKLKKFISKLPFKLTDSQVKVTEEIINDLQKGIPMNRLVQGEVGSGKTVVAVVIAYLAHLNGFQTLYMAPTEILAFQHFETLTKLLSPFGISVGIYTGSRKFTKGKVKNEKAKVKKSLLTSEAIPYSLNPQVIVGTHALLSSKLELDNVGLIIVDEQQRFGVAQRSLLRAKGQGLPAARLPAGQGRQVPHFLTMTATPIPRTVALTLYGDLDLSIIDELPKGRMKVKTHLVPNKKRLAAYGFIRKKVREGDSVYIITPLIEQSETMQTVKAATVEFAKLKDKIFPDLRLGLLHGRLKSKEKEEALHNFKDQKIDILVSTSVVEVGVDAPNATIMVIEGAERFGLAQLHQLRGRVGRGTKESFCFLFSEDKASSSRLKSLEKIYDGLKLAELDLKIRGSGEIFGTRQSGRFELKIASLTNLELIKRTRKAAENLLQANPTLDKYPSLQAQLADLANIMPD